MGGGMSRPSVIFDIDHTLAIDNKLERVAFLHVLGRVIANGGHALGSLEEESAAIDNLLVQTRSGMYTIDEAVQRFVDERQTPDPREYPAQYRNLATSMVEAFVVPMPDALPTLNALAARGDTLAVLSNGWNPLQVHKARAVGFRGRVFASADLGLRKPDPRAFRAVLGALGVEATSAWYVGDDPATDIPGALAAGMRAVWLDCDAASYPADVPPPTLRIRALADLIEAIP